MSNLILPPSPNWFQHNGVSSRPADQLFVCSCFKSIVPYHIPDEKGPPKALKMISHGKGKVTGVSVFPDHANHEFGNTIAVLGDQNTISLFDMRSGSLLAQQKTEKLVLNSLCWGEVKEENIVVAVGENGTVIIWQPKYLVSRSFTLEPKKNITVVEVLPQMKHQALVALDKTILLISLQDGSVISQLKGHDMPIYCIRLYPGKKNPKEISPLQVNTRWKKEEDLSNGTNEEEDQDANDNIYFASSDLGRNIFVWDLKMKRFIAGLNVPLNSGGGKKQWKDRYQGRNYHITLNWYKDRLLSSTIVGEVLEWDLSLNNPKYKVLCQPHSRVIYNMEIIGDILITSSQDRMIKAHELSKSSPYFSVPTMGMCARSMAFSPHDGNRLAIGMQDECIRLLTFSGGTTLKMDSIHQNIKGHVMALAWHPVQETKLLFGTSEGQVGVADIISYKTTTFAYFHQKSTYKVEFGPPVAPEITELSEEWCPYSFGDRELLARNFYNPMADPIQIDKLLGIERGIKNTFCLSEFTFSPCRKYLVIGSVNGEIKLFDRMSLHCLIIISRVRKVIQHLLWKPALTTHMPYVLGVSSGEKSVYIFNIEKEIKEQESKTEDTLTVTQATHELCGHEERTIWLSWSLHKDGLLASSSYDQSIQVWDTNTGEPVSNYGGHAHRVFRAEFSPIEHDKVVSFAEENCVHEWRPSQQPRTRLESTTISKEYRKRVKTNFNGDSSTKINEQDKSSEQAVPETTKQNLESNLQIRRPTKKSSFPLFHNASSHKKNFHHLCLLSLVEMKEAQHEIDVNKVEDLLLSEDLEEELEDETNQLQNGNLSPPKKIEDHIGNAIEKYSEFVTIEGTLPEVEDVAFFLRFFGSLPENDIIIKEEIKNHDANDFFSRGNLMHCWQGSLEERIRYAAVHKKLDPILVSLAPQVSLSLWEFACQAYAEQLIEADDMVTAATYLIAIHKDEEAINVLLKNKYYKEALTIAKHKLGFNEEIIHKVLMCWANSSAFEGNFELGSLLHFYMGDMEHAARTLSRRIESRALVVSSLLYLHANCHELAVSTAIIAFKEASNKNEFSKFEPILKHIPQLQWCKCINICFQSLWDHGKMFRESFSTKLPNICELNVANNEGNTKDSALFEGTLVKTIKKRWERLEILPSVYQKFSKDIKNGLSIQKTPSSLKNLWFLVSISLCEMLLDGERSSSEDTSLVYWEQHLESILKIINFWGKNDQTFYLTHILLPKGICDLSVFEIPILENSDSSTISRLRFLYILSELKVISDLLENDEDYPIWKCEKEDTPSSKPDDVTETAEEVSQAEVELAISSDLKDESKDSINLENLSGSLPTDNGKVLDVENKNMTNAGKINHLHLFVSKVDFFRAFESYVDFCAKNCSAEACKDCIKYLAEILTRLHSKALINLEFLNNILSKIET